MLCARLFARLWLAVITAGAITLCGGGCSYSFTGGSLPADVQTITVEVFLNEAPIVNTGLAQALAESLRIKYLTQTKLKVVAEGGDWTLSGRITEYGVAPITVQQDRAAQNRFTLSLEAALVKKEDAEGGWKQRFSNFADFPIDDDFNTNENRLVTETSEKIVQDIFTKSLSNW